VLHVSARWSAHYRHQWVASSQELLGSHGVHPLRSLVTSVPRTELHIRRTDLHLVILHAQCFEIDDSGKRGHSQKHYKRRSRLDDRKFVFANRVVNKFCYLRFVLIVLSVLRHWL